MFLNGLDLSKISAQIDTSRIDAYNKDESPGFSDSAGGICLYCYSWYFSSLEELLK